MGTNETVKDRLIQYIEYKHITKSEFCRNIGVSTSYVTSIRASIQPEKMTKIIEIYSDLNIGWLLTGFGKMINSTENDENLKQILDSKNNEIASMAKTIAVQDELLQTLREKIKYYENITFKKK